MIGLSRGWRVRCWSIRRWSGSFPGVAAAEPTGSPERPRAGSVWVLVVDSGAAAVRWCSSRSMRSSRVSSASSNSSAEWSWDSSCSRLFSRGYSAEVGGGCVVRVGLLDRADVGALRGDLEQQVTEQEAGERPVRADTAGVGESAPVQGVQERFHPPQAPQRRPHPGRGGWAGRDQREHLGVGQRDPPYPVREALQVVLPLRRPPGAPPGRRRGRR